VAQDPSKIAAANEAIFGQLKSKLQGAGQGFNLAAGRPAVAQPGVMDLLKGGKYGAALKTPGGMFGALMLAQFLVGQLMKRRQGIQAAGLQEEAITQQAEASPDEMYYQAALPSLTQERQGAQDALLQAILGERGQQIQVPGERRI
jgi:hypothetical protein